MIMPKTTLRNTGREVEASYFLKEKLYGSNTDLPDRRTDLGCYSIFFFFHFSLVNNSECILYLSGKGGIAHIELSGFQR